MLTFLHDQTLTLLLVYGYPILGGAIFLSSFGIPVPSDLLMLVAGSLAVDGSLNLYALIILVTVLAFIGDLIGYYLSKKYGLKIILKYGGKFGVTSSRLDRSSHYLNRFEGWAIFFSRWLFTPFGFPLNILAGISNYPIKTFTLVAFFGEALWASLFVGAGYLFGANWNSVAFYLDNIPDILSLFLLGWVCLAFGLWLLKRQRLKKGF